MPRPRRTRPRSGGMRHGCWESGQGWHWRCPRRGGSNRCRSRRDVGAEAEQALDRAGLVVGGRLPRTRWLGVVGHSCMVASADRSSRQRHAGGTGIGAEDDVATDRADADARVLLDEQTGLRANGQPGRLGGQHHIRHSRLATAALTTRTYPKRLIADTSRRQAGTWSLKGPGRGGAPGGVSARGECRVTFTKPAKVA